MFSGKCFGKDAEFPIISDSTCADIIPVQDIRVGYHLIGHDGTLRRVISTCAGVDKMYKITYNIESAQKTITVTQDHVLCLMRSSEIKSSDKFIDVPLNIYCGENSAQYANYTMYYRNGAKYRPAAFTLEYVGEDSYYGFTVMNIPGLPDRVLLADHLVVHNTIQLFNQLERHWYAKRKCLVIQHSADKRYDHLVKQGGIVCNNGEEKTLIPTVRASKLSEIDVTDYDVIGVNEGQFYPDLLVVDEWANAGKIVIVDGLDGDINRENFGQLHKLIPKCEKVTKLCAICVNCGKDAPFTIKIGETEQAAQYVDDIKIDVGGAKSYAPVCRACYNKK